MGPAYPVPKRRMNKSINQSIATVTTETILIFFLTNSTKISERDERKAEEFSIFIEILKRAAKRFRFLSLMMKKKKLKTKLK